LNAAGVLLRKAARKGVKVVVSIFSIVSMSSCLPVFILGAFHLSKRHVKKQKKERYLCFLLVPLVFYVALLLVCLFLVPFFNCIVYPFWLVRKIKEGMKNRCSKKQKGRKCLGSKRTCKCLCFFRLICTKGMQASVKSKACEESKEIKKETSKHSCPCKTNLVLNC
jgi:hypothetical protein